ncbi:MAG: sulfite exporter TauE/SafE family protein [Flavobacteriaceae bacterium]|nr:sulfite exporter TauE/SafE family protein [Flavobacteriaceae bacterium]
MELLEIFGYLAALLIGVVLGLIGGGGSILTVPVFVYLFAINPVTATAYSLFVVGLTALAGALQNMRKGLVDFKTAIVFSIPAFIAVYVTRRFIMPAIPDTILTIGNFMLTKNIAIMVFFAIIMLLASWSMLRNKRPEPEPGTTIVYNYPLIIVEGFVIGILTGLVGAGGGFLIIPALVLLAKLPMKKAVATSLLIIAVKSLIGFIGDIELMELDWNFLILFSFLSIIGIFAGVKLNHLIDGKKLKKAFGWFVFIMAIYILLKEISSLPAG